MLTYHTHISHLPSNKQYPSGRLLCSHTLLTTGRNSPVVRQVGHLAGECREEEVKRR